MYFLDLCEPVLPFIRLIKNGLIPIIQIGIPIILIVLGMFDLGKAVVASKEDEIKSAQKLAIKRVIYFVIVWLVPWLVNVAIGLLDSASTSSASEAQSAWSCWVNN